MRAIDARAPALSALVALLAFASAAHAFAHDEEARAAWLSREPGERPARALSLALSVYAAEHPSAERAVNAARGHFWLGLQEEEAGVAQLERRETFSACVIAAEGAQRLDDELPGGYFFEAVCRAKVAEIDGIVQSMWQFPKLKRLLDETHARDPAYAFGGIGRFWGAVITKTPGFLLGLQGISLDDGAVHFQGSLRQAPDFVATKILRAQLLLRRGQRPAARATLVEAATTRSDDPEIEAWNRFDRPRAEALLRALDARAGKR